MTTPYEHSQKDNVYAKDFLTMPHEMKKAMDVVSGALALG